MSAASFLGIAGWWRSASTDCSIGGFPGRLANRDVPNLSRYAAWAKYLCRCGGLSLTSNPSAVAAAIGTLAVISFYLIAQMVGAGNLIKLLFGLDYELAVMIVGGVMLAYVIFGGMIATTWVQNY